MIILYLGCVQAKNTAQIVLRDIGHLCKEVLPSKALWMQGVCYI